MHVRGLIPRNFAELDEAVPIVCVLVVQDGKLIQSGSSAGVLVLVDKCLWDTVYPSGKLV